MKDHDGLTSGPGAGRGAVAVVVRPVADDEAFVVLTVDHGGQLAGDEDGVSANGVIQLAAVEQVERAVERRVLVHGEVPGFGADLLVVSGVHLPDVVENVFRLFLLARHVDLVVGRPGVEEDVDRVGVAVTNYLADGQTSLL